MNPRLTPSTPGEGTELTGAQALIAALEHEGVECVFGLPGGAILPVYDPLIESSIRHILVRHEQGAGHMAEGYAHVTGRAGVVMVTSGPAATNIVTPLADAYLDSIPLVAITGQVPSGVIGTDAFQECDTVGITMPVTKHSWLVTDAADIPEIVQAAFHVATTGRPGPVLIDIPKDVAQAAMRWKRPGPVALAGYRERHRVHPGQVRKAAALMRQAERPVLYVGGGVLKARGAQALQDLVDATDFPVVTTLMARGAFPDEHPRCLGMPGMHGNYTAITAMQHADLLVALGARFDDRVTGRLDGFAPTAKIIHVDIDPAELGKIHRPDVSIVSDCRDALEALVGELGVERGARSAGPDLGPWHAQLAEWQQRYPLTYDASDTVCKPQQVIDALCQGSPGDTIVVSGVGQHQMWAAQRWTFNHPYTWVNSGGLGTMGFAVPAAIGAKVARPDRTVWAVDGDGCFQMTAQELVTATCERIPVKVAILNNSYLGMVRQWQELFYEERYSEVHLSHDVPDYVKWAEAMGCAARRVDDPADIVAAIAWAHSIVDRPVVIDFRVDWREKVYPMVAAGTSNDEVIVGPSL